MPSLVRLSPIAILSILLLALARLAVADQAQPTLPSTTLLINGHALETEIAVTSEQRYMGLSYRKQLSPNAGMLFVYSREEMLVFTMRNTLIPLSIAFISADMTINEIHKMNVGPNQLFPAKKPARFALEVNQGWFKTHGIKPGDKITLE